jgi:hypothetical protein
VSKPIKWLKKPQKKNYPAARRFLELTLGGKEARSLAVRLRRAKVREIAARDLLRASRTPMSEVRAFDWTSQNKDIKKGKRLSPILVVCGTGRRALLVADGFHRLCAVFAHNQDAVVRYKIA